MSLLPLALILACFSRDKVREVPARVTLDLENPTVAELLDEVKRQTGILVEMDESACVTLNPSTRVRFKLTSIELAPALELFCRVHGLDTQWKDRKHVVLTAHRCIVLER